MIEEQMRVAMFGIGAENLDALRKTKNLVKVER
jgi:isopentenyl diphosphate isomerase/L-lactate dehydrogenase-like FMN-dependent dehydrogenase